MDMMLMRMHIPSEAEGHDHAAHEAEHQEHLEHVLLPIAK